MWPSSGIGASRGSCPSRRRGGTVSSPRRIRPNCRRDRRVDGGAAALTTRRRPQTVRPARRPVQTRAIRPDHENREPIRRRVGFFMNGFERFKIPQINGFRYKKTSYGCLPERSVFTRALIFSLTDVSFFLAASVSRAVCATAFRIGLYSAASRCKHASLFGSRLSTRAAR